MSSMAGFDPVTRYRAGQRKRGRAQVLIWMEEDLKQEVDDMMRLHGFKNRSEAITSLIRETIQKKGRTA